jgi:hypothetical protein
MEAIEKAKIRLEHWIDHNEHHYEEYSTFADELEKYGKTESARYVREMMALTAKSNTCLKEALKFLE